MQSLLHDFLCRQLVWPSESCRLYGDGVVTAIPVRLPVLATKYDARRPAGSTAMSRQGSSRSVGGGGTALRIVTRTSSGEASWAPKIVVIIVII